MKQVIARIRDCRPNGFKTIASKHFYSVAQYEYEIMDFVKTLMPGQEVYIKVGNKYQYFKSYEELMEDSNYNKITLDDEMFYDFREDYSLNYYIKNYLPIY